MPDLQDDFDFEASLRERFKQEGLPTEDPDEGIPEAEAEVEEQSEGRRRDERGRFVAEESEEDVEVDATDDASDDDETVEQEVEELTERLYAGKYKTAEELERAYEEIQSLEGRRSNELGDLRRELQQLRDELTEEVEDDFDDFPIMDTRAASAIDSLVEQERYAEAALLARRADPTGLQFQKVMKDWVEESPYEAMDFNTRLANAETEFKLRQELGQTQAREQSRTAKESFRAAWTNVIGEFPDMGGHAEDMLEAAKSVPGLARDLDTGSQATMENALRSLYWMTKGRQADTPSQEAARQASKTAKKKAAVASASSSPSSARTTKSPLEEFKAKIVEEPSFSLEQGFSWRENAD